MMEFFYALNFALTLDITLDVNIAPNYNCPVSHL
jgi:hypothetical protein